MSSTSDPLTSPDSDLFFFRPFVLLPGQAAPKLPNFSGLGIHPVFLRSLNELD